MLKEFKEFALRGNVMDLAIGVIIGAAFSKIVDSLVKDIIMPPLGVLMGGIDFSDKVLVLKKATESSVAVSINYGLFLNAIIGFLIVAFAIFLVVKQMNRFRKKEEKAAEVQAPREEESLLREIRDILRSK